MIKRAVGLLFCLLLLAVYYAALPPVRALPGTAVPRINVPYTSAQEGNLPVSERAIFWFGQVGPTLNNYSDVRVIYNDDKLHITLHIFDRYLWYDMAPTPATLTDWDSVTLYLNTAGNIGGSPGTTAYQFVGAFDFPANNPRDNYQATYQGNGAGWVAATTPFTTDDGWQGQGINDLQDDAGWNITFRIPYSSLGFSGPPPAGTTLGFALAVHDRDDAAGSAIPDQLWPQNLDANTPSTWGQLVFGLPTYTPPQAEPSDLITIKHGVNGANVPDVHAGGDTTCAGGVPPFWPTWGNLNYAGDIHTNIQNQWNLGDWACFSKYYVIFPLDSLPANQAIISATLTLYHFGNSLPSEAEPSWIQVFTVGDDWSESTLTWNNASRAIENIARTYVEPLPGGTNVNRPIDWDVSAAVAEAYANGQPLRLAMYSADNAMHSGKYFRSSDANQPVRPTLTVQLGSIDGFVITADTPFQTINPGDTVTVDLDLQATGNFNEPVSLSVSDPSPDLDIDPLSATIPNLPGQLTLTLTDLHDLSFEGDVLYIVPITATGGDIIHTAKVYLLINGYQVYLPTTLKKQ